MRKNLIDILVIVLVTVISILLFAGYSNAQSVGINNSGAAANSSAMLDVSSTTKGVLIPRMRTIERTAIVNPAEGLLVYDNDTKGFWFYSNNTWNEMPKSSGGGGGPSGPAGGDLSGNYPTPNVVKIQNLDIAFGVPLDKQVLKWDMLNNKWQGQNDSLFLPYNSIFGSPTKLFGITNTNTSNGATAIYGKSGNAGSGINPGALTIGVWGDNSSGPGVMGTSSNHVGTYGYSVNNHGTYGFTSGVGFAGVYGGRVNNGPAVMGEVYNAGFGIYGKSNGASGKAALFETVHVSNIDTAVKFLNKGLSVNSYFINDNTSNTGALINGEHFGAGGGIYMKLWNAQNNNPGIYMYQYGNGDGLYVGSNKSKVARFYANGGNADTALTVAHDGTGTGIQINLTSGLNTKNAVDVVTEGTGNAAKFVIDNSSNSSPAININTNGTGRGLQSIVSNLSNLASAVYGSGINKGVEGIAQNTGVLGQSTGLTGGIGVLGQSALNSNDGIGVKGISYSDVTTLGAVTAENNGDGVAVYASSAGANGNGIGVYATTPGLNGIGISSHASGTNGIAVYGTSVGSNGIGIYGLAGLSSSTSRAAYFSNLNASNTKNTVEISSNAATTSNLYITNLNAGSTGSVLRLRNSGNGNLLLLEDGSASAITTISKAGNVTTNGTVTVNGNKGIVRSSSGTQLRTEIVSVVVPAVTIPAAGQFIGAQQVNVNFATPFSSAPVVTIGNITAGSGFHGLPAEIINVTTTGFTFSIPNYTSNSVNLTSTTIKVLAIGAE